MTRQLINKRKSRRIRFDPQDAERAARLAERDAAYRLALGLPQKAPLPAALGTHTGSELDGASLARRP